MPLLTQEQQWAALKTINISEHSPLMRVARFYVWYALINDPDDLLQQALELALTRRRCRMGTGIEAFIMGIMRSIASRAAAKQRREPKFVLFTDLSDQDQLEVNHPSPLESIERLARAVACQGSLNVIANDDPVVIGVIDGIGHGFRGADLAKFAGVDQEKLGTVLRLIKRRVTKEMAHFVGEGSLFFEAA